MNAEYIFSFLNTVDSRYIEVIYSTILHTEQQLQRYNFGQTLHSRTTPHTSPSRANDTMSKKHDRDISKAHCIDQPKNAKYHKKYSRIAQY